MAKTVVILFVFILMGWFLFTYKLTDVPPGINGDEAAIGYSASLIAKTGYDANGQYLPIFTNISWPDWKQPITVYTTVAAFKLFGVSYFNLKAVSVFFVLFSGTIIFFLAKEVFGQKLAILSLLIFATIPAVMIQSHLAIENIAPLPFVAIWLWMLAKYTSIKKTKYLVFSSVALGISLYSYLGLRLIMPVLTIISICYIYYLNHQKKIFAILTFLLGLAPFILFMLIVRNQYPAAIFASNRPQDITSYQQFLLPYISSFDLSFLFMKGDLTPYHSTGKQGMFLLATLPLFLLGLFKIASKRKPFFAFVLLVFFLTPILYGLTGSIYRASRLVVLLPPFIIITLLGIQSLSEIKRKIIKLSAISVLTALVLFNYVDFAADYWFDYSNRVNQNFEKPIHKVFDYVSQLSDKENLNVFIQDDAPLRNPTVYLFFENSYFPKGLPRWVEGQSLPGKSAVMVSSQVYHRVVIPLGIETVDNGDLDLNVLINRSNENK